MTNRRARSEGWNDLSHDWRDCLECVRRGNRTQKMLAVGYIRIPTGLCRFRYSSMEKVARGVWGIGDNSASWVRDPQSAMAQFGLRSQRRSTIGKQRYFCNSRCSFCPNSLRARKSTRASPAESANDVLRQR